MTQNHKPSERSILRTVSPTAWILIVGGSIFALELMYGIGLYYNATMWDWADLLLVPATIVLFGLWFKWSQNKRERKQREHDAIVNALQGEKVSVGYVAYQVRNRGLDKLKGLPEDLDRSELIEPLCLAAFYEGSNQTRALVLSALERCALERCNEGKYRDKIKSTLDDIFDTFDNYQTLIEDQIKDSEAGRKIERHYPRFYAFYRALRLEPPPRLREIIEASSTEQSGQFPRLLQTNWTIGTVNVMYETVQKVLGEENQQ